MEVADTNPIIITQFVKKGMARIPKSIPIEILEHNNLTRVGVWIALTVRCPLSTDCGLRHHPSGYELPQGRLRAHGLAPFRRH
jgi:hypothetical protein